MGNFILETHHNKVRKDSKNIYQAILNMIKMKKKTK